MTDFDEVIDRRNTHSAKWDVMEALYGVSPDDGISMWVADMDFKPPEAVNDAVQGMVDHGIYGYYGQDGSYRAAISGWMARHHDWHVDPAWIFTTHGLVNGTALCVQTYTDAGDGVILFTPVYHAFARVLEANNRRVVESALVNNNGRYEMDLGALENQLQGDEKMVILCSPHNPGGRVWSQNELRALANFCVKHDLILLSDEIHHDLVFSGNSHTVMSLAAPEIINRLVMLTAPSKTFNLAGCHTGNVIIEDKDLRAKFARTIAAGGISGNSFGMVTLEAAYNNGDAWLADLISYIDENRRIFDAGINAIPGLKSMSLEATYLAWVDFSRTGMTQQEFTDRIEKHAKIAANYGPTFGKGGESYLRFNIATRRALVEDAVARITAAFSDLQ
ncbi:MAG: MalY/PatB family protein [Paracoccaceae bacterium]